MAAEDLYFAPPGVPSRLLVWVSLGVVVSILLWRSVLRPAYFSPLAKIPSINRIAPLSSLWMLNKRYRGEEYETVAAAFKKHGPIVRIGPKEIAINFLEGGIRTVYGRGYHKPSWYDHFILYGRRNIVSTLDETHGTIRKRISNVYGKSYLQKSRHFRAMASTILQGRMIPILQEFCQSGSPVDMLELCFAYGIDMITATQFGLSCSTNLLQDKVARYEFLKTFTDNHSGDVGFWLTDCWDASLWLAKIGLDPIPKWYYSSRSRLEKFCLDGMDAAEKFLISRTSEEDTQDGDEPIVYGKMREAVAEENKKRMEKVLPGMPPMSASEQLLEIASELLDHTIATREDFGITLTSIFHHISKHPECQPRLHQELMSVAPNSYTLPSPSELETLPFFNGVVKEGLRLRENPPLPNPRVTPPGEPSVIGSYAGVPPGTQVIAFSRCLHHNPDVYQHPDRFIPERWLRPTKLETDEERAQNAQVDKCEQWWWPFSSGSRMCLASNMTTEMIRLALAAVYLQFYTTVEEDTRFPAEGNFVEGRAEDRLLLKLVRITET